MVAKNKKLAVLGGGEHARVVIDAALASGWEVIGFFDPCDVPETVKRFGVKWLGDDSTIKTFAKEQPELKFILGLSNLGQLRTKLVVKLKLDADKWGSVIHPSAVVADGVSIGEGSVILAKAILQTGTCIGPHCILNSGSIAEHDLRMDEQSHLGPGAMTGGGCVIGARSLVGLGSRIRDHIRIGDDCVIGTGSVVVADVPDGLTVAGIPAIALTPKSQVDFEQICISPESTLLDAMAIIAKEGSTIALVTDKELHLLGTLTDGDIRKSLLNNKQFDIKVSAVMNREFIASHESLTRAKALDLMNAQGINHLPVLNASGKVTGLHFLAGYISQENINIKAVIMAGGKGTRLRPITDEKPKPLVNVAGRPILEHLIFHLISQRITDITIAVNYKAEMIEEYFGDGHQIGCQIHYLKENEFLGTAGALSLLEKNDDELFLVLNGDLITQFDVEDMLNSHEKGRNEITVGVRNYTTEIPYGVIEVKGTKVSAILEKPQEHRLVNAGIYLLSSKAIDLIPKNTEYNMTDLIAECITSKQAGIYLINGEWIDIGEPEQLQRARGL